MSYPILSVFLLGALALDAGAQSLPPLLDVQPVAPPLVKACAGLPDSAPLPATGPQLAVPGVSQPGQAIQFNAFWQDVHNAPGFTPNAVQRPQTCGDWKAAAAAGRSIIQQSNTYVVTLTDATGYSNLWRAWDLGFPLLPLTSRPADFDQQVIARYGLSTSPVRNPYPLAGEDPNLTNGGSGQLPQGLGQQRDASGRWTGQIGATCQVCHASTLGTTADAPDLGSIIRANDNQDVPTLLADLTKINTTPFGGLLNFALTVIPVPFFGQSRGRTQAILSLEFVTVVRDLSTLNLLAGPPAFYPFHGAPGDQKPPNWWNVGFRQRMFQDGGLSSDAHRVHGIWTGGDMLKDGAFQKSHETADEQIHAWFETLSPPAYPGTINTALAEQGAVLFHTRDLHLATPMPGNGSCAGCHGVYSPRYAADPTFLSDPRLIGVAPVRVPLSIAKTDPNRANWMSPGASGFRDNGYGRSWWSYSDDNVWWSPLLNPYTSGAAQWTSDVGYIAPVLHGIWAAAPYLHNGSVPTLHALLNSSERPIVWRRKLTPPFADGINRSFDSSLAAYDFANLGWQYDLLNCDGSISGSGQTQGPFGQTPTLENCRAGVSAADGALANLGLIGGQYSWAFGNWALPSFTEDVIESRYAYNTLLFSHGNGGHTGGDSLSEDERVAIIEYLKTL